MYCTSSLLKNELRMRFEFSRKTLQKLDRVRGRLAYTDGRFHRASRMFFAAIGMASTISECLFSWLLASRAGTPMDAMYAPLWLSSYWPRSVANGSLTD